VNSEGGAGVVRSRMLLKRNPVVHVDKEYRMKDEFLAQ